MKQLAMPFLFAVVLLAAVPLAAAGDEDTVVAHVGQETVTLEQVDRVITGQLIQLRQQKFDLRRAALDQVIAEMLVEREAKAREMTIQDLLKVEIEQKIVPPTDEEIATFYERNKERVREIQGKSLDQATTIVRTKMLQRRIQRRQWEYIRELRAKAGVRTSLEPPRMDVPVPAGEPSRGPESAPVTMVEFSDYQCGFCKKVHPTVEQLLAEYGDRVRFVYRDYAMSFHPRAFPAAKAARCAGEQGKYWEYHNHLLEKPGDLEDADLAKRAGELGLDTEAFGACYGSDRHEEAIRAGLQDGSTLGVTGTPTFFINGRILVGFKTKEEFASIIDEELARRSAEEK